MPFAATVVLIWLASGAGLQCWPLVAPKTREDSMLTKLGTVDFRTSCAPRVKSEFNRGVALLHSFWHDEAFTAFENVASSDPNCAMAYWGEAMTHFHQLLALPTAADVQAGSVELAKADSVAAKSPREAAYIRALHRFFDAYQSDRHLQKANSYADAMAIVAKRYPDDLEARVFYALALLASQPPEDLQLANSRKAYAILEPLFREHPSHPGIAHYIIHACDNPQMAREGLKAARQYTKIAPQVPHALHMPAHIFARLGLWQDDIESNLASKAAAELAGLHRGAENRLHAMEFLEYAYLQTGRFNEAEAIVTEAQTIQPNDVDPRYPQMWASVEARYPALLVIETKDWAKAERLNPELGVAVNPEPILLAHAEGAAHMGDPELAKETLRQFEQLRAPGKRRTSESAIEVEIRAWLDFAQGQSKTAIALLRPVADQQAKTGKGEVEIPAREMLAEMLLLVGRPAEAIREYRLSLQSDPNRFNALLGAVQAARRLGRNDLAKQYRDALLENCPHPDGEAIEDVHEVSQ